MEINPRKVFERLFGQGGNPAEREARFRQDRSLLDAVRRDAASLQLQLGPSDRRVMNQFLDNVREIERRIQLAGKTQDERDLELPTRPAGVPFDYEEHVELMYDLMMLAYQADVTRVISFMVSREVTARTYPQVGVFEGHHSVSHHANRAEKIEQNARIQTTTSARSRTCWSGCGARRTATDRCWIIAAALRQQHEQQQRARSLPAAERR